MKPVFLSIMATVMLVLDGCKKSAYNEPEKTEPMDATGLVGAWELRTVYGGFKTPDSNPQYAPGNGNIWVFTDSTYALYANGEVIISGSYQHVRDTAPATGTEMDAIVMPQNGNLKSITSL